MDASDDTNYFRIIGYGISDGIGAGCACLAKRQLPAASSELGHALVGLTRRPGRRRRIAELITNSARFRGGSRAVIPGFWKTFAPEFEGLVDRRGAIHIASHRCRPPDSWLF